MPHSFFNETVGDTILTLLQEIDCVLADSAVSEQAINKYLALLNQHLSKSTETNISERLKRAIHKTIKKLDEQRPQPDETAMDTSASTASDYRIQIPSAIDVAQMDCMPAGGTEDQRERLTHITECIIDEADTSVVTTESAKLNEQWLQLFEAIDKGARANAFRILESLAESDSLLQLILSVHSIKYLKEIITECINACKVQDAIYLDNDIVITAKTFALLIKDIATTIQNQSPLYFSFGLPSHHAFNDQGSGFCILNKTAILMRHQEACSSKPQKYVVIGMDVNRDNGLCEILTQSAAHLDTIHVDIFDPRVYPRHTFDDIKGEFTNKPKQIATGVQLWTEEQYNYYAVDLSRSVRKQKELHPALLFALDTLKAQVKDAIETKQQVALYLPMGWDSHELETAECGKMLGDRMMTAEESKKQRFNDQDLSYFYEQILSLYSENKAIISSIYWGLEGGYDRKLYEHQVSLMLSVFAKVQQDEPETVSQGISI